MRRKKFDEMRKDFIEIYPDYKSSVMTEYPEVLNDPDEGEYTERATKLAKLELDEWVERNTKEYMDMLRQFFDITDIKAITQTDKDWLDKATIYQTRIKELYGQHVAAVKMSVDDFKPKDCCFTAGFIGRKVYAAPKPQNNNNKMQGSTIEIQSFKCVFTPFEKMLPKVRLTNDENSVEMLRDELTKLCDGPMNIPIIATKNNDSSFVRFSNSFTIDDIGSIVDIFLDDDILKVRTKWLKHDKTAVTTWRGDPQDRFRLCMPNEMKAYKRYDLLMDKVDGQKGGLAALNANVDHQQRMYDEAKSQTDRRTTNIASQKLLNAKKPVREARIKFHRSFQEGRQQILALHRHPFYQKLENPFPFKPRRIILDRL